MTSGMQWLVIVSLLAGLVFQDNVRGQAPGTMDPQAEAVLKKLCEYGRTLKLAKTEVAMQLTVKAGASTSKMNVAYLVTIAPPNRVVVKPKPVTGPAAAAAANAPALINDGQELFVGVPTLGRYVQEKSPAAIDELASLKHLESMGLGHPVVATALLPFRGDDALKLDLVEARYLGEVKLGAVKCHHLKLGFKLYDVELWVDTTDKPTIRKAEPDLARWSETNKDLPPAEMKPDVQLTYKPWITTGLAKPDDFKIVPTAGLAKVASFDVPVDPNAHPLLNKAAPPFQLRLLQGGAVNLTALRGKQIVILDFWATWCGPCVRSLPEITAVAAEFQSKGVAFYAVNLDEDAETISAFMTEQNMRMPVALDTGSAVAGQYGVRAIPQTLIIDRNGIVKVAHVGAGANIRQQLTDELNSILAESKGK